MDPQSQLCQQIISHHHVSLLGGHSGYKRILYRIKYSFWWSCMKNHIKKWVQECDTCQRSKHESVLPPGLLKSLSISE